MTQDPLIELSLSQTISIYTKFHPEILSLPLRDMLRHIGGRKTGLFSTIQKITIGIFSGYNARTNKPEYQNFAHMGYYNKGGKIYPYIHLNKHTRINEHENIVFDPAYSLNDIEQALQYMFPPVHTKLLAEHGAHYAPQREYIYFTCDMPHQGVNIPSPLGTPIDNGTTSPLSINIRGNGKTTLRIIRESKQTNHIKRAPEKHTLFYGDIDELSTEHFHTYIADLPISEHARIAQYRWIAQEQVIDRIQHIHAIIMQHGFPYHRYFQHHCWKHPIPHPFPHYPQS